MTHRPVLPFGAWPSPISMDMVVAGSRSLSEPRLDGGDIYFLEGRPTEGGRVVLMRRAPDGSLSDVTPRDLNVRTRVHEYGGGAYAVGAGRIVFSDFASNRLHVQDGPTAQPRALTEDPRTRFADMELDLVRGRVLAVLEDHRAGGHEPRNLVCDLSLSDGTLRELLVGHDFYSDPRLDADGRRMAWLSWDRPAMPWDGTSLWVARLAEDGTPASPRLVAGGESESVVQPTWAPDGSLIFASDRSGWWNLYRWREAADGTGSGEVSAIAPMEAEAAGPAWVFGLRTFAPLADGSVLLIARSRGRDRLLRVREGETPVEIDIEASDMAYLRAGEGVAVLTAASLTQPRAVVRLDLASGRSERLRESASIDLDAAWISIPRHVEFPTQGDRTAFAFYYPPTNPQVRAAASEKPPLVVMSHGGPTSCAEDALSLGIQAFTSRGFAVVDVDYGGSTGYGRGYRDRLLGAWGVVDVDDCSAVALWLAQEGLADRRRLAIRGGSAGGFTTLAALCFRDVFSAGASYFGVGDLEALARDTHKFESRYLDRLVAPYPEDVALYRERSPIHAMDRLACPILVLQGTDDMVVPQAQADEIVAAAWRNGIAHAYLLFEGEGHGFRRAENQRRAREAELSFYAQVFGFQLADDFEPIEVVGLAR